MKRQLQTLFVWLLVIGLFLFVKSRLETQPGEIASPGGSATAVTGAAQGEPAPGTAPAATGGAAPSADGPAIVLPKQKPIELPHSAWIVVRDCLSIEATTLEGVVGALASKGGGAREERHFENFHVTLPGGEKRRVRLAPPDGEGEDQMQLQVFGVDDEDLPVPKFIPQEHRLAPDEAVLRQYLTPGEITLHQVSSSVDLGGGRSAEILRENGAIRSLHLTGGGARGLGCAYEDASRAIECDCLE